MQGFWNNRFLLGLVVFALFIIGFAISAAVSGDIALPADALGSALAPVRQVLARIGSTGGNLMRSITEYDELLRENEQLRKRIEALEDEVAENERFRIENEELKSLLGLKEEQPELVFEQAEVIGREAGDWHHVYIIDRGEMHGVKKDMPVITADGLVGKIMQTGQNWSKVLTILDRNCSVGAVIQRTRDPAVAEGEINLAAKGFCRLSYIDSAVNVNRGDIIETSGLGYLFPKGIRIGRVEEVMTDVNGLSQYAVIKTAVDFSRLSMVFVVKEYGISE